MFLNNNVGFNLDESFEEKQRCCGCNACSHVCPKKCITLKEDSEGFLYPQVDKELCIKCSLCKKVCPVLNAEDKSDDILDCYIGYFKEDNIRLRSSSGGLFYPLAKSVINHGGVVFGVAFDEQWNAHHISVYKLEELPLLLGSKYIQSRTENTFDECKDLLNQGREVLYSGVACQIAGLKAFLKKDFPNLLTIDVLCHGTPSPKVWQRYLTWKKKQYKADVNSVDFRNKKSGWSNYLFKIDFVNNKSYVTKHTEDEYFNYFLSDVGLRPSCHNCRFKALERPSDITLGDAWGINNHHPEFNDEKGSSIILIHTEKGKKFFSSIASMLNFQSVAVNMALPKESDSRKSVKPYITREAFFKKLSTDCGYPQLIPLLPKKPGFAKKAWHKTKNIIKQIIRK